MSFGWFVVVAGTAAGCYYGYRKLQQVEADIRAELKAKGLDAEQEQTPPAAETKPTAVVKTAVEKPPVEQQLEGRILAQVKAAPGMLQTELYKQFSEDERKAVQAALLTMDKAGFLKRTKEKSTYRLDLP